MNVAVEILLEGLQRVEERAVGVAERGLAVVVVAHRPQGGEGAAELRVLGFVLGKQLLLDRRTGLLRGDAGREQLVLLAGQVRLQLASDLTEETLRVAEPADRCCREPGPRCRTGARAGGRPHAGRRDAR